MHGKIIIKTPEEIKIMIEAGKRMAHVKKSLYEKVLEGVSAYEVEELAVKLIKKSGGEASFKRVAGYKWATCINVNEGIVHGIPKKDVIFEKGDIVSVDCGVYYNGFHSDTSFSKGIEVDKEGQRFLDTGEKALKNAIKEARIGNRIYDISEKIESIIRSGGYTPVRGLVGHGVGRELHEPPEIPCLVMDDRKNTPEIVEGMVIAIEVMYAQGEANLVIENDGWTISTSDDKISGLFEDTVAVTKNGPLILTDLG
jgi:methionyl aminopeptidase